jgi:phage gpG-like protein
MALRNKRTGKEFSEEMNESSEKFKRFINKTLPDKVKDFAQKIVDDSFQQEQYKDGKSSKWQDRKDDDQAGLPRSERRALLVKSGKLIRDVNVEQRSDEVVIGTDVEYAQRHNEGLAGTPQRQFMPVDGESNPILEQQIDKFVEDELDKMFS